MREELRAHLEERTLTHRVGGMDEQGALERALAELGDPGQVRSGMVRLYTLPTVAGSSFVGFILLLTVVSLWPKGAAQTLDVSSFWPSRQCIQALADRSTVTQEQTCFASDHDFWVSQRALRRALEPQGVVFKTVLGPAAKFLSVTVPETTPIFLTLSSNETMPASIYVNGQTIFQDEGYLSLWNLVKLFVKNEGARLEIGGWDDPTVKLNDVAFRLRDEANPVDGRAFFWAYFMTVVSQGLMPNLVAEPTDLNLVTPDQVPQLAAPKQQLSLNVPGNPGDAYGLLSYVEVPPSSAGSPRAQGGVALVYQLAKMSEEGLLRFYFVDGERTLVENFDEGQDLKIGESVLVRLAGGNPRASGWYEVVSPKVVEPQSKN